VKWHWLPVVLVAALLLAPAGSPVQLSYVYSDSMEPTLHPGDGYVLHPAGEPRPGDVVTFRKPATGELVTHRVVAVTEEGLVTKGDANDVTDQAAGARPVPRSAVVGEALAVGGTVVRIPGVGAVVSAVRDSTLGILGLAAAGLLLRDLRGDGAPRDRRPVRAGAAMGILLAGLGVVAVAMVFVATTTQPVTYVAVGSDADDPKLLTVGEPAAKPLLLEGTAPPLTHRVVSAEGADVTDVTDRGSRLRLTVSVPPPETRGPYRVRLRVYHYPATLPRQTLEGLHAVHPLVAAIGSVGAMLGPLVALALLWIDSRRPLRPPRSRRIRELIG